MGSRLLSLLVFALSASARAATIGSGTLVEDFTTLDHADLTATTGVWNAAAGKARVTAYANGHALDFGDGSDGVLDITGAYSFDTDTHALGYKFTSVHIHSGATISVSGSNPLIIRSLGAVIIEPTLSVSGTAGSGPSGAGDTNAPAAGHAVTCGADGGAGGSPTNATSGDGVDGLQSDSSVDAGNGGPKRTTPGYDGGVEAIASATGPFSNDFDTAANFICGAGGAGGGLYDNANGNSAAGASGGGGGGRIRIVAAGDITMTAAIEAKGGDGGAGTFVPASGGTAIDGCSGNGAGGYGGTVWLQTLGAISGLAPAVDGGAGGTTSCSGALGGPGRTSAGVLRADMAPGGTAPWDTPDFRTDQLPSATSSVIVSKSYDLGTFNAAFPNSYTLTSNGIGRADIEFAGSADDASYSAYTADLASLGGQGYRYLRFRITLTATGAGASPEVSRLALSYQDLGPAPLDSIDLKLSAGCGTVQRSGGSGGDASTAARDLIGAMSTLLWSLLVLLYYGVVRTTRLGTE